MRFDRNNRELYIIFGLIGVITFIIAVSFITFMINIKDNKGVIPLIFLLLALYSFVMFIYYLFFKKSLHDVYKVKKKFKLSYLIMFFVSMFMYTLSFIVLWK